MLERSFRLKCDICGRWAFQGAHFEAAMNERSVREYMAIYGWLHHLSFGDLCQNCIPEAHRAQVPQPEQRK